MAAAWRLPWRISYAEPDDKFGAPAIEVGLELSSPHFEPTDLPPGPDADASAA